jgi:D-glycero-alpha-D-manno-heptose-7-phosphate kinase
MPAIQHARLGLPGAFRSSRRAAEEVALQPSPITVSCPARIDLAGGTLDIAPLCHMIPQARTINLAIDWRSSVQLRPAASWSVQWNDEAAKPAEEEPIFAAALAFYRPELPHAISVQSHIPRAAGLGGSSTLLSAFCQALSLQQGRELDAGTLLQHVSLLEHRLLGKPAGVQDAFAAILGGLNSIDFSSGTAVHRHLPANRLLAAPLYLLYSDQQHHSGINNWRIIQQACEGDAQMLGLLGQLAENAGALEQALLLEREDLFRACLTREASLRAKLEKDLVPEPYARFCQGFGERLIGKICGAGGGGCMLLYGQELERLPLQSEAARFGLSVHTCRPEARGVLVERLAEPAMAEP